MNIFKLEEKAIDTAKKEGFLWGFLVGYVVSRVFLAVLIGLAIYTAGAEEKQA